MQTLIPAPRPAPPCWPTPALAPAAWRAHPRHGFGPERDAPGAVPASTTAAGSDAEFMALLQGYRSSGGLARTSDMAGWLHPDRGTGPARLAAWVAQQRVIHFEWQSQTWLPWFQFSRPEQGPDAALAVVLSVLARPALPKAALGAWARAAWFARPHDRLAGRAPLNVIGLDAAAVLQAAAAEADADADADAEQVWR